MHLYMLPCIYFRIVLHIYIFHFQSALATSLILTEKPKKHQYFHQAPRLEQIIRTLYKKKKKYF